MREIRTLGSVCATIVDCEHKTAPIDDSGSYFAVGTPAMKDGEIDYSQARRISSVTFEGWTRRMRPKAGDLLFAREAPVGPIVRIPAAENVAPGQRTVLLRPDENQVDSSFLFYLLRSPFEQRRLQERAAGSTVLHLNVADVRAFELPELPSVGDQRAIAEVLGALDDTIAANRKLAEKASELCDSIYLGAAIEAECLEPVSLASLVTTQYGLTTSAVSGGAGPKLLRVTDINKRPWIEWSGAPACSPTDGELEKYRTAPGDILVARMADPGKAAFVDDSAPDAVFASYLVRLKAHDPSDAPFIYYFLRSPRYRAYAEGAMTGSVQKNMNARIIVDTTLCMPNAQARARFNARIYGLRNMICGCLNESAALTTLRDTLLPRLMSGELRVRDAERVVEEAL